MRSGILDRESVLLFSLHCKQIGTDRSRGREGQGLLTRVFTPLNFFWLNLDFDLCVRNF